MADFDLKLNDRLLINTLLRRNSVLTHNLGEICQKKCFIVGINQGAHFTWRLYFGYIYQFYLQISVLWLCGFGAGVLEPQHGILISSRQDVIRSTV